MNFLDIIRAEFENGLDFTVKDVYVSDIQVTLKDATTINGVQKTRWYVLIRFWNEQGHNFGKEAAFEGDTSSILDMFKEIERVLQYYRKKPGQVVPNS